MKLPVIQILSKNKKHYQIVDASADIIVTDVPDLGDALKIQDVLNGFDRAIFLLEQVLQDVNNMNGNNHIDYFLEKDIATFLKNYK